MKKARDLRSLCKNYYVRSKQVGCGERPNAKKKLQKLIYVLELHNFYTDICQDKEFLEQL